MEISDISMDQSLDIGTTTLGCNNDTRWTVHVEVRLLPRAAARFDTIRGLVHSYLLTCERLSLPSSLQGWQDIPDLALAVDCITVCESPCPSTSLKLEEMALQIHVYQPSDTDSFEDFSSGFGDGDNEDGTTLASACELPNKTWEGLWDSLLYADNVKMKLLDYIQATLILSDANVNFNLISWNRVVLLHGPPGTGKTSLCRALAQKLSIRLSHRYSHARLLEINSHSLFSKWFSESGKLVQRLFNSITELVEEEDGFLVVLIDEVESLTAARAGAMAGTEPSDGLRVVNALLTQLDKIKHRKNVLVMSTSNLVKAIDSAFIDRADIVQYIDLPSREASYEILRTCLCEMINKGVITPTSVPSLKQVQVYELGSKNANSQILNALDTSHQRARNVGLRLLQLAAQCKIQGMSGRALRRLPVLALARYISTGNVSKAIESVPTDNSIGKKNATINEIGVAEVEIWLDAMERVLSEQVMNSEKLL